MLLLLVLGLHWSQYVLLVVILKVMEEAKRPVEDVRRVALPLFIYLISES